MTTIQHNRWRITENANESRWVLESSDLIINITWTSAEQVFVSTQDDDGTDSETIQVKDLPGWLLMHGVVFSEVEMQLADC